MPDLKLGRSRPSEWDAHRLSLTTPKIATTLPTPPSSIAKTRIAIAKSLTYPMMGNADYGDCTVAAAGHTVQSETWYEERVSQGPYSGFTPADTNVVAEYLKLTGGADNGLALLDVLKPWQQTGLWGHKLAAYAEVPWADPSLSASVTRKLLKTSTWLAGSTYLAVWLPAALQRDPYNWTKVGTGADWRAGSWGGHCIPTLFYASNVHWIVTWGKLIPVTEAFLRAYADEAWMPVSRDWVNARGKTPNGRSLQTVVDLANQIAGQASGGQPT